MSRSGTSAPATGISASSVRFGVGRSFTSSSGNARWSSGIDTPAASHAERQRVTNTVAHGHAMSDQTVTAGTSSPYPSGPTSALLRLLRGAQVGLHLVEVTELRLRVVVVHRVGDDDVVALLPVGGRGDRVLRRQLQRVDGA